MSGLKTHKRSYRGRNTYYSLTVRSYPLRRKNGFCCAVCDIGACAGSKNTLRRVYGSAWINGSNLLICCQEDDIAGTPVLYHHHHHLRAAGQLRAIRSFLRTVPERLHVTRTALLCDNRDSGRYSSLMHGTRRERVRNDRTWRMHRQLLSHMSVENLCKSSLLANRY